MPSTRLVLTMERTELESRERSRRGRADAARRARVVLLLSAGDSYASITAKTGCSSRTIALWKQRFESDGIAGLTARHRGSKPTVLTPELQARILAWTRRAPPHGATHRALRDRRAGSSGVQHTIIARAWRDAGLQPHRAGGASALAWISTSKTKAADVIGLDLDSPQHAVVFCIDEKTAIQALDRIPPGHAAEILAGARNDMVFRTTAMAHRRYAVLNPRTGAVSAVPRHTSHQFVAFLTSVVDTQPRRRAIHIIVDNLSAHKTQQVRTFLAQTHHRAPPLHADGHLAPAESGGGSGFRRSSAMSSPAASSPRCTHLRRQLMRYVKHYNKTAKPFRWSYADPTRRIA